MRVSHFSVFLNIQICAVFGPDKFSERERTGTVEAFLDHFSVDCFNEIPALKAIYAENRVLKSVTVPQKSHESGRKTCIEKGK